MALLPAHPRWVKTATRSSQLGKNCSLLPTEFCQESLLDLIFHRVTETGGFNLLPLQPRQNLGEKNLEQGSTKMIGPAGFSRCAKILSMTQGKGEE